MLLERQIKLGCWPRQSVPQLPENRVLGLDPGTVCHYRVVGQNAADSTYGADMTFTAVIAQPTAITDGASAVGQTGATINGTVNAGGGQATVSFEYGADTNYGSTVAAAQNPVSGSTDTAVSDDIADLTMGTTYHCRVTAGNSEGAAQGADMTFTTRGPGMPVVTTEPVTEVAATSAMSGGEVTDDGGATVTARGVCWATAPVLVTYEDQCTSDGSGLGGFTSRVTGLQPETYYYLRAYATNSQGTIYGNQYTFTAGKPHMAACRR